MTAFEGLNQDNFDAYTEEKWSSMVHNLTRMKAKETLTKLIDATRDSINSAILDWLPARLMRYRISPTENLSKNNGFIGTAINHNATVSIRF